MSTFPIRIRKLSMDHRGGTKSYHTVIITRADGISLGIYRWGKKGAWGSMDFERGSLAAINRAVGKKEREKESRGYQPEREVELVAKDAKEFQEMLGSSYYFKLGDHLTYLIPEADTKGVREGEKLEFEKREDGSYKKVEPPPKMAEVFEEAPRGYANNPNWGAF